MLIIFLGPPGSGKGTQAKITASKINLPHLSTGDMLRGVAKSASDLGKNLREILGHGKLVSDEIVNKIVAQTFENDQYKQGCIIDGFPRTLSQAEFLNNLTDEDYRVIYLKIDSEFLKRRIEGRFSCINCQEIYNKYFLPLEQENVCNVCGNSKFDYRSDDNLDALLIRLREYDIETLPLVNYYQKLNKLTIINAGNTINEVNDEIIKAIKKH